MRKLISIVAIFYCSYVNAQTDGGLYKEPYRPIFHFSPAKNWTNDPNGLVHYDGEYHLFYQYNPYENKWGHMSWGHAVSRDLVHWQHLQLAIPESENVMIFSGGAVVDFGNRTGFGGKGKIPMVAIYTGHRIDDSTKKDEYTQAQYLAYSLDKGRNWTKYSGNPVLDIHQKDFRDPNVFWYEPGKYWIMSLVLPKEYKVQFYKSENLKSWNLLSEFGPAGDTSFIWECPALVEVPIKDQPGKKKWVLFNSVQYAMQYFVGEFDGKTFHNESRSNKILRPDEGPDYYAAVTYNNLPANASPVLLGWASSWRYVGAVPTSPWRGAMALPRTLSIMKSGEDWVLLQHPVAAISKLRTDAFSKNEFYLRGEMKLNQKGNAWEMHIQLEPGVSGKFTIRFAAGKENHTDLWYDADSQIIHFDRFRSGNTSFHPEFLPHSEFAIPIDLIDGKVDLNIYFDNSIVEVYAQQGRKVFTAEIFPEVGDDQITLISEGGATKVIKLDWWRMKSAW